jgi:hypothetical protein
MQQQTPEALGRGRGGGRGGGRGRGRGRGGGRGRGRGNGPPGPSLGPDIGSGTTGTAQIPAPTKPLPQVSATTEPLPNSLEAMQLEMARQQKIMQDQMAAQQKMMQEQMEKHQEELNAMKHINKKDMEKQSKTHLQQLYKKSQPKRSFFSNAIDNKKNKFGGMQGEESGVSSAISMTISMLVTLVYFLFVILTKTAVGVFNCEAPTPPTGKEYMDDLPLEQCWVPGGVHERLVFPAVVLFFVYCLGFPVIVCTILYKMKAVVKQDQMLRARKRGDSYETNPHYVFRKRFGRLYYQYRPEYYWWLLVIIFRKFAICSISIVFKDNPTFQLAAALFVMFGCFALHVRYRPFLDVLESADVVKKIAMQQIRNKLHLIEKLKLFAGDNMNSAPILQLEDKIEQLEHVMEREDEDIKQHHHALLNLNTLEAILLGISVLVLLAGITFDSVYIIRAPRTKSVITWTTIVLVILSFAYIVFMVARELWIASHKAKAKSKFLWKSLKLQRQHIVHKLIDQAGTGGGKTTALMKRLRTKRGLGNKDELEKKLKEKEVAMNDHKQELAGHKNELEAMKKMVAAMKSDHSDSIEEEKRKSELAMRNLELQVEAETNSLVDELAEVERARRLSTSIKMRALSEDELKAHASKYRIIFVVGTFKIDKN